ncbi:DUF1624 domain-containing protein, partial [Escherichia coli]|nr:DUF1624 domain-containing protein [Escherichia coli]
MVATRLNSIQIMRGIAALIVVAFHIRYNLSVYEQKNLGDLMFSTWRSRCIPFFVISGFIISLSTRRKESPL